MNPDVRATIRLFNYRCFGDADPGLLEIAPGFTAYVGANNSGKSTLIRAIRELKPLLSSMADPSALLNMIRTSAWSCNFQDTEDTQEIGHDQNNGPVVVEVTLQVTAGDELSRARFSQSRITQQWTVSLFRGPGFAPIPADYLMTNGWHFRNEGGGQQPISVNAANAFVALIAASIYIPAFRHAIAGASGTTGGDLLTGQDFLNIWDSWQSGGIKAQRQTILEVVQKLEQIFDLPRLQLQPATGNSTIQLFVDAKSYRLREMGAGLTQFLLVLATIAIRRPTIIFIDEPELNLHPALQQDFLSTIGSYSSYGVIFATHALGLARTAADQLYSVQRHGFTSAVRPWETQAGMAELLGELSYSAYRESGHTDVLCVEGLQDVRPVQQLLRLMRLEHSTLVLPLGGDQACTDAGVAAVAEIQRLGATVTVLMDSEREAADGAPKGARVWFAEQCRRLGVELHLTARRALENYFSDRALKAALGPNVSALSEFQSRKTSATPWSKGQNWRVAREMSLEDIRGTDLHAFLESLQETRERARPTASGGT